ncbi:geranylgeranylglycerol-phosphate geranylgeranyltransferase [Faecalibacter bovis]|uniref:Geranylgeranylglycerol-phosphate geranylgeranyltransferase n=1 Tax=Faecalibacter bovis TaxID=2898187 RepID=A0ABX7XFD3_9FLAO|nr:geranylgeranylglycerol-phosphate geranylgeranyltransferase [Faecalibacter bovis]QTV06590.1 geranylgeranylglycerol-phosphate geranylgeranyltransferase [Faecalibacter bovis]
MNLQKIIIKLFALFSVIRGYNLIILMLAQYLACLFIFAQEENHVTILTNLKINGIILSSILCVAAGYIINNFYDLEKDRIKRPMQSYINKQVSQGFKLRVYIILNSLALLIASSVSWRVLLYFFAYQILVWFYSHKMNRFALIKNLYLVVLRTMPFFALVVYFEKFDQILLLHASFLTILFLITDIVKNLASQRVDLIYNYNSIPIKYGTRTTKRIVYVFIIIDILLGCYLIKSHEIGLMKYFFMFSIISFLFNAFLLWRGKTEQDFKILHYFFKGMIVAGVFSISLIEINPLTLQTIAQNFR